MGLKIDLFCNDGSPIGVIPPRIYNEGVGGAELAMMTWAEIMAQRGHKVRIFNDPTSPGCYDDVEYLHRSKFEPSKNRDAFILFRSPNPTVIEAKAKIKIHWSTDQYTIGNFATDIFPFVDKVVCISPFHVNYHKTRYGIEDSKIGYFDLGVRLDDYNDKGEKIPGRCIFCSVPDRGLDVLYQLWPQIKERVPEASLVITSDYRLWGNPSPGNHHHRLKWLHSKDVIFLGRVERKRLIAEQKAAMCQPYPCTYEELFCISAAECQVAGAIPVTPAVGALTSTNQYGTQIPGNITNGTWKSDFVRVVSDKLTMSDDIREIKQAKAKKRFDWNVICKQWEDLIETGDFN